MHTECTLSIVGVQSRPRIRQLVIEEFLKESPGTGTGQLASTYCYFVETIADGRRVFLSRPGWLNKAFDFVVRVEDTNFHPSGRVRDNPTHADIIEDLSRKKESAPGSYAKFFSLIGEIYQCQCNVPSEFSSIDFVIGHPPDLLLAVIKWMFIEQDIAYWNYSGRAMLMSKLPFP